MSSELKTTEMLISKAQFQQVLESHLEALGLLRPGDELLDFAFESKYFQGQGDLIPLTLKHSKEEEVKVLELN